ncbi:hypothetical protein DMJ13_08830 [halophilic archaeon]|nr:hypothetical protein DMJ13_08830 [halophilic archaeon]
MTRRSAFTNLTDRELTRRQLLAGIGGGAATVGGAKAVDNVVLGYGVLVGTNLRDQNLGALARERFGPSAFSVSVSGHRLRLRGDEIRVRDGDAWRSLPLSASPEAAAELDAELGLEGGPLEQLVRDLGAISAGEFRFEFAQYEEFFDRVRDADDRPFTVQAVRGNRFADVPPETVESFTGASPKRPEAVVEGLVGGFRDRTSYDVPRYVAGSVEDNVIFGATDLRKYFRSPTTFDAIESGDDTGMFCYEFTWRSVEALHALPAHRQRTPVVGAKVFDDRHKHVYTGVASVVRRDGDLVVPMTFVDYTHTTLYDDLNARGLLGEGLRAYDDRHRATAIYWQP